MAVLIRDYTTHCLFSFCLRNFQTASVQIRFKEIFVDGIPFILFAFPLLLLIFPQKLSWPVLSPTGIISSLHSDIVYPGTYYEMLSTSFKTITRSSSVWFEGHSTAICKRSFIVTRSLTNVAAKILSRMYFVSVPHIRV